jgi:RHO1 GDP-GTP exchange protein 1/2
VEHLHIHPSSLSAEKLTIVPDFTGAGSNIAMSSLKTRCEAAKPLGLVRAGQDELLVVYEGELNLS